MTTTIADTSFVVGLLNAADPSHDRIARAAAALDTVPWLPAAGLAEIIYMLHRRAGAHAGSTFVATLGAPDSAFALLDAEAGDYVRAAEVMRQYADTGLDFVDALVVGLAERLNIRTILTLDHRHFGAVRPRHCAAFELRPAAR